MENVIVLTHTEPSKAYQSLSEVRARAAQYQLDLEVAVVVEVDERGAPTVVDGIDTITGTGTAGGGLIGALVGVLGGPVGVLLGLTGGALIGTALDAEDAVDAAAALPELARAVPPGSTALVVVAEEEDTTAVDSLADELGSTVYRRPAHEVFAEVEAARAAQEDAARSARDAMREQRSSERKAELQQKWEEFKAGF